MVDCPAALTTFERKLAASVIPGGSASVSELTQLYHALDDCPAEHISATQDIISAVLNNGLSQTDAEAITGQQLQGAQPFGSIIDAAKAIGATFTDIADAIKFLVGFLTNPQSWIRIGEAVAGAVLVLLGVYFLAKTTIFEGADAA